MDGAKLPSAAAQSQPPQTPPKDIVGSFIDVKASAWYTEPVIWAVENGITAGIGENQFAPNNTCIRAQIASFLYRYFTE